MNTGIAVDYCITQIFIFNSIRIALDFAITKTEVVTLCYDHLFWKLISILVLIH